jgi:hypothetical protein
MISNISNPAGFKKHSSASRPKSKGLLTPKQYVFTLTDRPGAFDVNRKQAQAGPASRQAALQRL